MGSIERSMSWSDRARIISQISLLIPRIMIEFTQMHPSIALEHHRLFESAWLPVKTDSSSRWNYTSLLNLADKSPNSKSVKLNNCMVMYSFIQETWSSAHLWNILEIELMIKICCFIEQVDCRTRVQEITWLKNQKDSCFIRVISFHFSNKSVSKKIIYIKSMLLQRQFSTILPQIYRNRNHQFFIQLVMKLVGKKVNMKLLDLVLVITTSPSLNQWSNPLTPLSILIFLKEKSWRCVT